MKKLLITAALFLLPAVALADPINQVSYASLTGTQLTTFDDLAGGGAPGTNYDGFIASGGVGLGERFVGQTLGSIGNNDTLGGAPTGPLTLEAGAAGQNLNIFFYTTSNVLTGLGPLGFPDFNAIGEGAFSVLFSTDQSQFGFDLVGGDGGTAHVGFFRADGSLIENIVLTGLANISYGFSRDGGTKDIRGISIWNDDGGGIGFDNLKYDVASATTGPGGGGVPEPTGWALMIAGFGLAGTALRRRRAASAA
jgi:hypothetical protein